MRLRSGQEAVARALAGEEIPGFGCSDCDCPSHLVHRAEREGMFAAVERAHEAVRE